MLLDPSSSAEALPEDRSPGAAADKMRIRFRKAGLLRLVSHHDLMHVFERMLRRAEIPFRSTLGFHPQPRIVFALSLALGVVGCEEVVEVELERTIEPEEIERRLVQHGPAGLDFLSVRRIAPRAHAQVSRVQYRIALPADRIADLPRRITELMASAQLWVERTRPRPRRLDLRPFIHNLRLTNAACGEAATSVLPATPQAAMQEVTDSALPNAGHLEMSLWVSGSVGTARPEEILQALGLADLLDAGATLERSKLELRDELPETEAGPPLGLAQVGPQPSAGETPKEKGHRPTSLLPGPLSFDS